MLALPASADAQGLTGLGAPGGLLGDPRGAALEEELLRELNARRAGRALPALLADARLRAFARGEAQLAAKGDPEAPRIVDRIKKQGIAPYGYHYQLAHGGEAKALAQRLGADRAFAEALVGDFARAGVGAFLVPTEPPSFQVAVLLARDPDPMASKPGLSQAETDPVMSGALPKIRACYDAALSFDPNLGGDVLFKIVIGPEGKVLAAELLRSLPLASFDACVLEVARALSFPKPYKGKPVTLNHPVRLTPPTGTRRMGKLTKAQIEIAFRTAAHDFQACYDARVRAAPGLEGTLEIALTVLADGAARRVRIEKDGLGDEELAACVLARARSLRFPAPEHGGEVDVVYPLRFTRGRKGGR